MSRINFDLKKIKAVIFDVDGVLSKETVNMDSQGVPLRTVNIKDGYSMQLAIKKGLKLAIITGGDTQAVKDRYLKLGVTDVYMSASDKVKSLKDYISKTGLNLEEIAYMGDDVPDYIVMTMVGLPCCPADASPEIVSISKYVSPRKGGYGCGRDLLEQILKAQGLWMSDNKAFGW